MNIDLPDQILEISVSRAANAPHYEYMVTVGKRFDNQYIR